MTKSWLKTRKKKRKCGNRRNFYTNRHRQREWFRNPIHSLLSRLSRHGLFKRCCDMADLMYVFSQRHLNSIPRRHQTPCSINYSACIWVRGHGSNGRRHGKFQPHAMFLLLRPSWSHWSCCLAVGSIPVKLRCVVCDRQTPGRATYKQLC